MRKYLFCLLLALSVSGCSLVDFDRPAQTSSRVITIVADSVEQAEPVLAGIEAATGPMVTEDQQKKSVKVAGYAETAMKTAAGIAAAFPGGQGVAAALGALGTLAGAIGTVMGRRKTKKVAAAAVNAADKVPGGGKALVDAAKAAKVGDLVNSVYERS